MSGIDGEALSSFNASGFDEYSDEVDFRLLHNVDRGRVKYDEQGYHVDSVADYLPDSILDGKADIDTSKLPPLEMFSATGLSSEDKNRIQKARVQVVARLAIAKAASHLYVACGLETSRGMVLGSTFEANGINMHAEKAAVFNRHQQGNTQPLKHVYIAGTGSHYEMKHICPCFSCESALYGYRGVDRPDLVVFEPSSFSQAVVMKPEDIYDSYFRKPKSVIESRTRTELVTDLEKATALRPQDREFVADLMKDETLKQFGVQLYLTGIASGRGGVGQVIHKIKGERSTEDRIVDIACVAPIFKNHQYYRSVFYSSKSSNATKREEVFAAIQSIAEQTYGSIGYQPSCFTPGQMLKGPVPDTKKILTKGWLRDPQINLSFADTLEHAIGDPDVVVRNFYHQLSTYS